MRLANLVGSRGNDWHLLTAGARDDGDAARRLLLRCSATSCAYDGGSVKG